MKKTTKLMFAIGFGLLLLTNACKKNDLPVTTPEETVVKEKVSARGGNSSRSESSDASNATVEISEELFAALGSGSYISMVPISEGAYRAVDVINVPIDNNPPVDYPCKGAWAQFDAYMAAHAAAFQQWADDNCRPLRGGWSHPCGLCILFEFRPSKPWNCPQEAFQYNSTIPLQME